MMKYIELQIHFSVGRLEGGLVGGGCFFVV